ncbi:MAG: hypothetical protein ACRCS6_06305, partial [Turicibacter sp.]
MKKFWIAIFMLAALTIFMGYRWVNPNGTELVYEDLSQKEEYLLNLTGNKIFMYQLNNMPDDIAFEILFTYEVYVNGEKVKEDILSGIGQDTFDGYKIENQTIGINIQSNKIRTIFANDSSFSSGNYALEEDLTQYSQAFFTNTAKLTLGSDIYLYYATTDSSISTNIPLGVPINSDMKNDLVDSTGSIVL